MPNTRMPGFIDRVYKLSIRFHTMNGKFIALIVVAVVAVAAGGGAFLLLNNNDDSPSSDYTILDNLGDNLKKGLVLEQIVKVSSDVENGDNKSKFTVDDFADGVYKYTANHSTSLVSSTEYDEAVETILGMFGFESIDETESEEFTITKSVAGEVTTFSIRNKDSSSNKANITIKATGSSPEYTYTYVDGSFTVTMVDDNPTLKMKNTEKYDVDYDDKNGKTTMDADVSSNSTAWDVDEKTLETEVNKFVNRIFDMYPEELKTGCDVGTEKFGNVECTTYDFKSAFEYDHYDCDKGKFWTYKGLVVKYNIVSTMDDENASISAESKIYFK